MKRYAILSLALLGSALAQVGPMLPQVEPPPPRPDWIRPGLVVLYSDGVGQTALFYLVTAVTPTEAYGASFRFAQSDAGPTLQVTTGPLYLGGSGPFYLAPQAVAEAGRRAPPGTQIQTQPGWIGILRRTPNGESKYAVRYDDESGLVLETSGSYRGPAGVGPRQGAAFHLQLAGTKNVPWTPVGGFPPAARASAAYQIVYALASGGQSPGGTFWVQPVEVGARLARYRIQARQNGALTPPREQLGIPAFGPHYLHPALLGRDPVLSLPELGFEIRLAGAGPSGGQVVVMQLGGVPIRAIEVDPRSGLVLLYQESIPGIGTTIYRYLPR